ncbi:M56 family metallopeptidase [Tenacibaculum haliotis]|uniref:M56 family metallopeptidase n=1 Tax=Tenacibaculum haliotis TaxID=1888914 RepID=UPI0021B07571|nr:M56 family metallopeptidase [Tenacibaculum haliotis]MCT4699862.1 M56 family metallopeptidase [Tenacibaculum haliotis]
MISYFIKSGICLTLLLLFYHLVLEREKMHKFNRFYLLGSVLFSFLAPLFIIYTKAPIEIIDTVQVMVNNTYIFETTEAIETPTNYWNYFVYLSAFISSMLLVRFTRNILSISQKTRKSTAIKYKKSTLILVDDAISPHTFWNYIFINKTAYESQKIEEELFTHELTHATQKHTFDVLLIEVLKIIFWFNPIFYFLKKTIQLNHEFLADSKVISNHKNISKYQHLLLNKTAWNNEYYLASNLNYLLTKKRLLMMTKQSSPTKILLKKLAIIPVMVGFVFLFAERVEAETKTNDYLDSEIITKRTTKINFLPPTPSLSEDINKKFKDINSLKLSIINQDTLTKKLPNGEEIKIWEDKVGDYLKLYKTYEILRNLKPHFIKSSRKRQSEIQNLFSELGSIYFKLSSLDKKKVKKPIFPQHPYIRLKKNNKVFYKLKNELTTEDKLLLPPPPPIPNASKEEILKAKKAYNAWKVRTGNIPPPPQKPSTAKIVKKGEKSNIPPPSSSSNQKNDRKTGWGKQVDKNGKEKEIREGNTKITGSSTSKNGIEKGWKQVGDKTLYYVKENGKTLYFNRYGKSVNSKGKEIKQTINIDKIKNLSNREISELKYETNNKNVTYYLNKKKISKKEIYKLDPKQIDKMSVKKNKDGSGSIYVTTKN